MLLFHTSFSEIFIASFQLLFFPPLCLAACCFFKILLQLQNVNVLKYRRFFSLPHPHPALQIFYLLSLYFLASVRTNRGTAGGWHAEPGAKLLLLSSSVILETARDGLEVVWRYSFRADEDSHAPFGTSCAARTSLPQCMGFFRWWMRSALDCDPKDRWNIKNKS